MSTQQLNIVCDNSTLTNFTAWAQAISSWFSSCGWRQSSDTGQVNWTSIAAVPSSAYVYEIWQPGDATGGLPTYYVKIEYGFSTTLIGMWFSIGTSTNGSGTLTGQVTPRMPIYGDTNNSSNQVSGGAATPYECDFYGDSGQIAVMMWRNATGNQPCVFGIERTRDTSGNKINDGVTMWLIGTANNANCSQRSSTLIFASGSWSAGWTGNVITGTIPAINVSGWGVSTTTASFQGYIPVLPIFVIAGKIYGPSVLIQQGCSADFSEGVTATFNDAFGNSRTWMASSKGIFTAFGGSSRAGNASNCVLMRYD